MSGGKVQVRHAPDLLTIETGADNSYSFDASGCLVRAAWDGRSYRWGLDGGCLVKALRPFGLERWRQHLAPQEGLEKARIAYRSAYQLMQQVADWPAAWSNLALAIQDEGYGFMQRRAERFLQVYQPVAILPPDQYGALVLQLTEGCRYNRCTYCTFYKNRPYRVKRLHEFTAHMQAVIDLVGQAMHRRRTIFLGDANALGLPFTDLCAAFAEVNRLFPLVKQGQLSALPHIQGIEGIYTFMDVFDHNPKSPAEFATLAGQGLKRVYLGAESGSEQVLRVLRKPEKLEALRDTVTAMKAGGVGVGLVFLVGAGGEQLADIHAQETANLLAGLPLDSHDIVYFSELVTDPHSEYAAWAHTEGIQPLTAAALRHQERIMRQGLVPVDRGGPRVTRYDVREFIYY